MNLTFEAEAEVEAREAFLYYFDIDDELGLQFELEFRELLERISTRPHSFPKFSNYRKAVMTRFPFCLFFKFEGEDVILLAVAHQRRRPGYWQKR